MTESSDSHFPVHLDRNHLPEPEWDYANAQIEIFATDSMPDFPPEKKAPPGSPNILLILLDDVGFGWPSVNGGLVRMPTAERLADNGLFYNQFHTTALCSPTRAAMLTGRNHHTVATGVIQELATGYPGYSGIIPKSCATFAELLKQAGYTSGWFGKNHNVPDNQTSAAGPFDNWPTYQGFDYFYGFLGGGHDYFRIDLRQQRGDEQDARRRRHRQLEPDIYGEVAGADDQQRGRSSERHPGIDNDSRRGPTEHQPGHRGGPHRRRPPGSAGSAAPPPARSPAGRRAVARHHPAPPLPDQQAVGLEAYPSQGVAMVSLAVIEPWEDEVRSLCRDLLEIIEAGDFASGMPRQRQREFSAGNTHAVVAHSAQLDSALLNIDADRGSTGI